MYRSPRLTIARDAAVATAVLAALYALTWLTTTSYLQLPGYVLLVGFRFLAFATGVPGSWRPVAVVAYLLALGTGGALAAHAVGAAVRGADGPAPGLGLAGALAVVGALALLLAAAVLGGTEQWEPVLTAGAVGVGALLAAAWLAGVGRSDPA